MCDRPRRRMVLLPEHRLEVIKCRLSSTPGEMEKCAKTAPSTAADRKSKKVDVKRQSKGREEKEFGGWTGESCKPTGQLGGRAGRL